MALRYSQIGIMAPLTDTEKSSSSSLEGLKNHELQTLSV